MILSCPRARREWFDPEKGEIRPVPCRTQGCPVCGPNLAFRTVLAITMAAPSHFVLITPEPGRVGGDGAIALRDGVSQRLAPKIREAGFRWEYVYTVELTERLQPHAHLVSWGDAVPRSEMRRQVQAAGLGWSNSNPIRSRYRTAKYMLKDVLRAYDVNARGVDRTLEVRKDIVHKYLYVNGGHLVHGSPGYWRDLNGQLLRSIREARKLANQEQRLGWNPRG